MRQITSLENKVRQAMVGTVLPAAFGGVNYLRGLAESRLRRTAAATRYCRGRGLEIGAAAAPTAVPRGVRVCYVDKIDPERLKANPELAAYQIQVPTVVENADRLRSVDDSTQDFVLAFMVIEHSENPLAMLCAFHRVVKRGGVVILSAPDHRYMFDRERAVTTFEHIVADYERGPEQSRRAHFLDYGRWVIGLGGTELERYATEMAEGTGHIHFHVWNNAAFLDFLVRSSEYLGGAFEVLEYSLAGHELLAVLQVVK